MLCIAVDDEDDDDDDDDASIIIAGDTIVGTCRVAVVIRRAQSPNASWHDSSWARVKVKMSRDSARRRFRR